MAYFPMFINLTGQDCLVVGGGRIALKKVQVLLDFAAKVTVVAPEICREIQETKGAFCLSREFAVSDLEGRLLVVAATDDKEVNACIARECRKRGIMVNAVDQIESCSFIFPSYIHRKDLVAAFSSSGKSPVMTQYLKAGMEDRMPEELGELTECLGSIRPLVKERLATEALRKKVYQQVLALGLEQNQPPSEEQIEEIIKNIEITTGRKKEWTEREDSEAVKH